MVQVAHTGSENGILFQAPRASEVTWTVFVPASSGRALKARDLGLCRISSRLRVKIGDT